MWPERAGVCTGICPKECDSDDTYRVPSLGLPSPAVPKRQNADCACIPLTAPLGFYLCWICWQRRWNTRCCRVRALEGDGFPWVLVGLAAGQEQPPTALDSQS